MNMIAFRNVRLVLLVLLMAGKKQAALAQNITVFPLDERPEGITEGPGSTLFVSQILSGKVLSIDVLTGDTVEVVGEQPGRQAWGLWYDNNSGSIFVAGGGPSFGGGVPEVYVYSVETGELLVNCTRPTTAGALNNNSAPALGAFVNDVTIRDNVAYITDSFNGKLIAMDAEMAVAGNCTVWEVDLPDNFEPMAKDDWGANGIVSYGEGLLVCHEIDGSVWYITDLEKDDTGIVTPSFQEVIPVNGAPGADGLTILEDKLYVTQNTLNLIGVFQLEIMADDDGSLVATKIGELTSPDFDTIATSAVYNDFIYSTNSRFVALPDISAAADDNVIGVKNIFCCGNYVPPVPSAPSPVASPVPAPGGMPPVSSSVVGPSSSVNLFLSRLLLGALIMI